jgi:chemotaxis protein MotB
LTDKDGMTDHALDADGKAVKDKNGKTAFDKDGVATKDKDGQSDKDKAGKSDAESDKLAESQKYAKQLESELRRDLKDKIGHLAEGLIVTPAEGGVLISVSDQIQTPMFQLGSSIPTRETIIALSRIAELLKSRKGQIAIRGHTDARPYKAKGNDNWRLSADRAQSAYFILKRAGIEEQRISQITGFADHRLKVPEKPLDAINRRIEILIQADES